MADRAKSSFLAAASHDLRQPLQTLQFLQAALEPHHPSGEARKLVAGIGQSLDTMTSILSSLLDVNRLESGNLRPSVSEFSLNEIFEPLAGDFAAPVRERGLQLRIVRSELVIRSDKRMLAEMIRNLLSNAVRYTDRGRILLGSGGPATMFALKSGTVASVSPKTSSRTYSMNTIREPEARSGAALGWALRS